MKKQIILNIIILYITSSLVGQKLPGRLVLNFDYGVSQPITKLSENISLAGLGGTFSLGGGYYWGKMGLNLQAGFAENKIDNVINAINEPLPFNTITYYIASQDRWKSLFATLGPAFQLGEGLFAMNLAPQIGILQLENPAFYIQSEGLPEDVILYEQLDTQKNWAPALSGEFSFNFQFSRQLGLRIVGKYLRTQMSQSKALIFTSRDWQKVADSSKVELEDILATPLTVKSFRPKLQLVNVMVGLSLTMD